MQRREVATAIAGSEVLEFLRLVWALDHGLQRISKRMRSRLGVTGPQRFVIRIVGWIPNVSGGELSRLLHLDPSTLTGILMRLEERGFIRRSKDPADGRRVLLHLTAKGKRMDASTKGTVEEAMRQALAGAPAAKIATAREVLQILVEAFQPPPVAAPGTRPRKGRGPSRTPPS